MGKMSVMIAIGILICLFEHSLGIDQYYYWSYPESQSALNYFAPYQPYAPSYAELVPVPLPCDEEESLEEEGKLEIKKGKREEKKGKKMEEEGKREEEEGEEEEEKGKKEIEEGKKKKGEKEERKGKEKKEKGEKEEEEGEEEVKKGEKEVKRGKKEEKEAEEEEEKEENEEEEKESEEKEEEKKMKKKKEKKSRSFYRPFTYTFRAKPIQEYVYSAPNMPYRNYATFQQQPYFYPYQNPFYYKR